VQFMALRPHRTMQTTDPSPETGDHLPPRLLVALPIAAATVGVAWQTVRLTQGDPGFGLPTLGTLVAAICALAVAIRAKGPERPAWAAIATGCLVWAYGRPDSFGATRTATAGANLCYVILVCSITLGALRLGVASLERGVRTRLVLDLLPPAIALGITSWVFGVGPYVLDAADSRPLRLGALLHGVGFLVMLTLWLAGALGEHRHRTERATWLLLTGIAVLAIGDALWLQRLTGWLPVASRLADGVCVAGFVLIGAAGAHRLRSRTAADESEMPGSIDRSALQEHAIPYVALGSLLLLAGGQALFGEPVAAGVVTTIGGALAVLVFVIARQSIAGRQERHLRRENAMLSYQIDGLMAQVGRDPLTGLLNHRAVHERLEHELAYGRDDDHPVAVVLIDVDNFKTVNDSLGHQAGDRVLRAVASILESACRTTDTAARYAGDEFMLLLPGLDEAHASQVCARIAGEVQRINDDLRLGHEMRITLSIGVAVTYRCTRSTPQTVAIADAAMYDAKESGKNRIVVVNADTLEVAAPLVSPAPLSVAEAMAESRASFPWVIDERRQAG
jgi:diguanylate cyclase (GGDEF)-like protein